MRFDEIVRSARRNEPLARHTTFRVGGPADWFVRAETHGDLVQVVRQGRRLNLSIFILGNGSNVLVADAGIRGLVIENLTRKIEQHHDGEQLTVIADSGASLPGLANRLARQGWSGLEWAIGVPSTVGAAVVGNAGAHGSMIGDMLIRAELLDRQDQIRWWDKSQLEYEYRASLLKKHPGDYVVLRAEFELRQDDPANCIARMNRYTEHRRRTQPTEPSVGSMFKNPPGDFAGRLIEVAGLKGERVGQVQVSPVHANFFVNRGGATANDVAQLIERVRKRVTEKFGVELELEIELVGEWK